MNEMYVRVPDATTVIRNGKENGAKNGHHVLAMYSAGRLDRSIGLDPHRSFTPILPEPDEEAVGSEKLGEHDFEILKEGLDKFGLSKLYSGSIGRMSDILEVKALELSTRGVNFTGCETQEDSGFDYTVRTHLHTVLKNVLQSASLNPREIKALAERFRDEKQLKEIGDGMGVSDERARQIIARALEKIRKSHGFADLRRERYDLADMS